MDEDGPPERFCTAACVVWQPRRPDRIAHASAGHPDVVLVRTDGRIDRLGSGGLPLGMFAELGIRSSGAVVAPGDLMVLFTDGVTEARDRAGHLFGDEGVNDALSDCAGRPPDETAETLLAAVERHSVGRLGDDLALLVVGWQPTV